MIFPPGKPLRIASRRVVHLPASDNAVLRRVKPWQSLAFDFPVAILPQHPYTLDMKRLLPAEPVCVAPGPTTAVREVAGRENQERSHGLVQKRQIRRFVRISVSLDRTVAHKATQ